MQLWMLAKPLFLYQDGLTQLATFADQEGEDDTEDMATLVSDDADLQSDLQSDNEDDAETEEC